jgi:hypothetical protein
VGNVYFVICPFCEEHIEIPKQQCECPKCHTYYEFEVEEEDADRSEYYH